MTIRFLNQTRQPSLGLYCLQFLFFTLDLLCCILGVNRICHPQLPFHMKLYFASRIAYLRRATCHYSCNLYLGKTHLLRERPSPCVIKLQSDNKICRFYLSRRNAQNTHITWKCSLAYLCKYFCPNINIFSCLSIMFVQSTFLCPLH